MLRLSKACCAIAVVLWASTTLAQPTPPTERPTASDEAPGGNEDNQPLVGYGAEAFIRHSSAIDCGDAAAAGAELQKLDYALDELGKRLKAAKDAGQFSAVKPADVQRQINLLESFRTAAKARKPKAACQPQRQAAQQPARLQFRTAENNPPTPNPMRGLGSDACSPARMAAFDVRIRWADRPSAAQPGATPPPESILDDIDEPAKPKPASASAGQGERSGPSIPTHDQVDKWATDMETAMQQGHGSEAGFMLEHFDRLAADLKKTIADAKEVGPFSNVDVREAEARLKQVEAWRKWGAEHQVPRCPPAQPEQPAQQPVSQRLTPEAQPKERPQLAATGQRFPAICSYESMTVALDRANSSRPGDCQNLSPFARAALAAHNDIRSKLGSPPMQWDPLLAEHALERSQELARIGDLVHAPRQGRENERENIVKAPDSYSAAETFGRWTREMADFRPGTFPDICVSGGDCNGVLHLTQMAWPTIFSVGCGSTSDGSFTWTVCRYPKGANQDGKEIGTPAAAADGLKALEAANSTVRARPVGGDYGTTRSKASGAWYVGGDFGAMIVEDAGFDYGLISDPPPTVNHEYGFDAALFIGYDLGAFRLEAETAYKRADFDSSNSSIKSPAANPAAEGPQSPTPVRTAPLFDLGIYAGGNWSSDWFPKEAEPSPGSGNSAGDAGTKVEQPALPTTETFAPVTPTKPLDVM